MSRAAALLHMKPLNLVKIPLISSVNKSFSTHTELKTIDPAAKEITNIDPLTHPDFFNVHNLFTIKDLFDARIHYGHKEGSLNDKMRPYIYGSRLGHLIFDLNITAEYLKQALNFTAHIAYRGGVILFLTRTPQNGYIVDKAAKECGEYSNTRYWRGGIFTNSTQQFRAVTRLPDLCIFLSTLSPVLDLHKAVRDSAKMLIPTIGIVDTNSDPTLISYPVPGNDDSPQSVQLFCNLFKEAILRGKAERNKTIQSEQ